MSATDELREKLTERGIEYTTNDHLGAYETSWDGFTAMQLTPSAKLMMVFTPEQAIAATLGGGECKFVSSKGSDYPPVCSACGYELGIYDCEWFEDGTYGYERNYCPNCGARVVE